MKSAAKSTSIRDSSRASWMEVAQSALLPLGVFAAIVLGTELLKHAGLLPPTIPAPREVFDVVWKDFGTLWYHLTATVQAAVAGFFLAATVSIALAATATLLPRAATIIYNGAIVTYSMPLIALAPILVVWFGTGIGPRVVVAALAAYFPILVGAMKGFAAADQKSRELFLALAANRLQLFTLLAFPSALPFLFSGLKIAAAGSILGAIVSEWVGAERGLGLMMAYALFAFNVPQVWLAILVAILLAIAAFVIVHLVDRMVVDWVPSQARSGNATLEETDDVAGGAGKTGKVTAGFALFIAALVIAWYCMIWLLDLKPYTLPTPAAATAALYENSDELLKSAWLTVRTGLLGIALSTAVALSVAGLFVNSPTAARALMPYAVAVRSVPIVAIAPLITLFLGRGLAAGVVIVLIATFFPIFVNGLRGFSSVRESYLELMRVNAATPAQTLILLRLPYAMPHIFAGLAAAAPVALLSAMLAEWLTGSRGLGLLMLESMSVMDTALLWAGMLLSMGLGLAIFWATALLERLAQA